MIQRFILQPTVPELRESELSAFVELYASICLENEWLAQKFLAHNKASIALVIPSNCCCNSEESARNSVKIYSHPPHRPPHARHFANIFVSLYFSFQCLLDLCVGKTSVVISVLSIAMILPYEAWIYSCDFFLKVIKRIKKKKKRIYSCLLDFGIFKLLKGEATVLGIYYFSSVALGRGLSAYLKFKKDWLSAQTQIKMYIHITKMCSP